MNAERQQRVMGILIDVVERAPGEREAVLARACGGDAALVEDVRRLLAREKSAAGFLEESVFEAARPRAADAEAVVGTRIGPYRVVREVGRGGMGAVFEAVRDDNEFEKRVAVKLIKRGMDTDAILGRFRGERQILASLEHPNIARLLDGGTTEGGLPFLVMEYVHGVPIDEYADARGLSTSERLKLFRTVCSAVSYAHQRLVVHRDIKPSNILVTEDGTPKLLDFGIAKVLGPEADDAATRTEAALRVMTPEYASPEQVRGERVTTATDVYSLGVVLYELLTGRYPYRLKSRSREEIASAVCQQAPEKPSTATGRAGEGRQTRGTQARAGAAGRPARAASPTPQSLRRSLRGDIDNIVLTALRKEPERRYASVDQFSEDVRRHLEGLPVRARGDGLAYRGAKFVRRHKAGAAAAALVALTLGGGVIATAREAYIARAERARAERRFNDVRKLAHSVLFDYGDAMADLPGSTQLRGRLVEDALEYLDGIAREAGDDGALDRELAAAYLKVGDVQGRPYHPNLGRTDEALASYRKALAILETLSAREPSNLEVRRYLATAYERIGYIQFREKNVEEASDKTGKALKLREGLLATDPTNVDYRREVADSYIYSGDVLSVACQSSAPLDCVRKALALQRRALAIREELAKENPSDPQLRRDVAQAYARVGLRLSLAAGYTGDKEYLRQSLESHSRSLAIREELSAADPKNARDLRDLADQYMLRADSQAENGDAAGALKGYRRAVEIFRPLSSADPSNTEAHLDLSFAYNKLAAALARAGDPAGAEENYAEALQVHQRWLANDPANVEGSQALLASYLGLGALSEKAGDFSRAIENYSKFVDALKGVSERRPSAAREMAYYYAKLGDLYAKYATLGGASGDIRRERWRAAKSWYQKSLDLWHQIGSEDTLGRADADKADEVAREIAKCDTTLQE